MCLPGLAVDLLLDLVAAVCAGKADDELQLLCGVIHELALQAPLLGLGGPGEPLVQVEQAVQRGRQHDQPPAHRSVHLGEQEEEGCHCLLLHTQTG